MIKLLVSFLLIRFQILLVSAGGFIWIQGFHLIDKHVVYIPLGFICLIFMLYAIIPYPHDNEKSQWQRKKEETLQYKRTK